MKGDELGNWRIIRKSDTSIEVEFPEGMRITGDDLDIEDLFEAIQQYKVIKQGLDGVSSEGEVTIKCCRGNTAIA